MVNMKPFIRTARSLLIGAALSVCSAANGQTLSCSEDMFGNIRCNDGTSYTTDMFGTVRDNRGNSWSTDMFGTTRGSDGTNCTTDMFGTLRCN